MTDDRNVSWFHWYTEQLDKGVFAAAEPGFLFTCPCCGYPTLAERGGYEVCAICNWEDDGQDSHNAAQVLGGPNGDYSLQESRDNFERHFTCYRPGETRAFTLAAGNIAWAKQVTPSLAAFRWKGRVEASDEIQALLRTRPRR